MKRLPVPTKEGFSLVSLSDVSYLKATEGNTDIVFDDKKSLRSSQVLKYFEAELAGDPFLRIHKSTLISLNKVKSYVRADGGYVIMNNNIPLAVSDTNRDLLFEYFKRRKNGFDKLSIPGVEGFFFADMHHVLYLKSDVNYTTIYFDDREKIVSAKTLKYYGIELAGRPFLRISNSVIINLEKVRSYVRGDNGYVIMTDGTALQVSRAKKEILLDFFTNKKQKNN